MDVIQRALECKKLLIEKMKQNKTRKDFVYFVIHRIVEDLKEESFDVCFDRLNKIEKYIVLTTLENQYRSGDFSIKKMVEDLMKKEYGNDIVERAVKMCLYHHNYYTVCEEMKKGRVFYTKEGSR